MNRDSISVALCTYQGQRFLGEQLNSIAQQTRPPDELVVCDDGSTDDTVAILERFRHAAPFPVHIHRNEKNLGTTKNFEKATGLCSGDVIYLCDQDDRWSPDKVSTLLGELRSHPDAAFVFCNGQTIDESGQPTGRDLWQTASARFDRNAVLGGALFDLLLRCNVVTGACMAFRSSHRNLLLPIHGGWHHDAWIALVLSAVAPYAAIDRPLTEYRLHPGQQIGAAPGSFLARARRARLMDLPYYKSQFDFYSAALQRLRDQTVLPAPQRAIESLTEKVRHARARVQIRNGEAPRLRTVFSEWRRGGYRRFDHGWPSVAQDLLM